MRAALAAVLLAAAHPAAAGRLDLPKGTFRVVSVSTAAFPRGVERLLTFPSAVKSPWPRNDTVWAHFIVPRSARGRPVPAVLVLPVMAAPNVWIELHFVRRFVADGMAVMWLEMPTQFHRRPSPLEPSGQVFLARSSRQLAANFRQSVLDARRALGVLAARPEVEPDRIAIFGISLGSLVGAAAYSADPRPRLGVFLLGGADLPSLVVNSSLSGPFARKMGLKPADLRAAWKGLDPLNYEARNAAKPALLVNARSDTVIPRANALALKRAFPDAEQYWVPFGHYTSIIHLLWLPRWVSGRIKKALESPEGGKKSIKSPGKA
ncbi:MAG: hypothetical protein KGM24_12695 [Elusimicrobia bacterium]|nr:hypothetical protein [Elusimicrobiota bacterium]